MIMLQPRNLLLWLVLMFTVSCSSLQKQPTAPDSSIKKPVITETRAWSKKAVRAFNQGNQQIKDNPDKAKAAFLLAIELEPEMEAAYYNLLRLYHDEESHDEKNAAAIQQLLEKAQKAAVLSARILTLAGTNKRHQGQFLDAEKLYLQALNIDGYYLTALVNMAILQDLYLQKLPEAQTYYQKYQQQLAAQGQEDKRLVNWLADLRQRIKKQNKEKG